jgi:hypothetical protein
VQPKGKPTLADVDGTIPGKVQLLAVLLEEDLPNRGGLMNTYVEEADGQPNPWLFAEGLKRGIERDWPDHQWAIVGNWRAHYLMWVQRQKDLGFLSEEDWSPQAYVDCH